MFTITDPTSKQTIYSNEINFMEFYISKWNEIHNETNIFRYKITDSQERIINNKYLLLCNPERGHKRRMPQEINKIDEMFDENKFNFRKVSSKETMFKFHEDASAHCHKVLVNVSPITRYHSLLCPSVDKGLPQVVTKHNLRLAIDFMIVASDRNLRIAFNSLCAFASVNHLHYHLCLVHQNLPVETLKCKQIRGPLYCLDNSYPAPAFCFEVLPPINSYIDIYKAIEYLFTHSIAHNLFITRGNSFSSNKEVIRVIIWPRKSTTGVKQLNEFNVAALELSGCITVYSQTSFNNLVEEDIDNELKRWKYDDFDELCDEIKELYE